MDTAGAVRSGQPACAARAAALVPGQPTNVAASSGTTAPTPAPSARGLLLAEGREERERARERDVAGRAQVLDRDRDAGREHREAEIVDGLTDLRIGGWSVRFAPLAGSCRWRVVAELGYPGVSGHTP